MRDIPTSFPWKEIKHLGCVGRENMEARVKEHRQGPDAKMPGPPDQLRDGATSPGVSDSVEESRPWWRAALMLIRTDTWEVLCDAVGR